MSQNMKPKLYDTLDEEYWKNLAQTRINKELDFSKIHSKEDYQYQLTRYLTKDKRGLNIINAGKRGENKGKISYSQIKNAMFEASQKEITPTTITTKKKEESKLGRKYVSLYNVYELTFATTSSKGKKTIQTRYQDSINGQFIKNPFK